MRTVLTRTVAAAALLALGACSPVELPEPESAGATIYQERCIGCHVLFPPDRLTPAMWEFQVGRMQGEMARRGFAPLNTQEMETLLAYLSRHAARPED